MAELDSRCLCKISWAGRQYRRRPDPWIRDRDWRWWTNGRRPARTGSHICCTVAHRFRYILPEMWRHRTCTYSLINRFDRCIFVSISAVLLCVAVKRSSPTRSAASDVGGVKMSRTSAARDGRTDVRASPGSFTSPFCPSFLVIVSCLAHFWTIAKFTRFCIHTTGSWFFSHSILVPTKVVLKLLLLVWCETSKLIGAACTCSLF